MHLLYLLECRVSLSDLKSSMPSTLFMLKRLYREVFGYPCSKTTATPTVSLPGKCAICRGNRLSATAVWAVSTIPVDGSMPPNCCLYLPLSPGCCCAAAYPPYRADRVPEDSGLSESRSSTALSILLRSFSTSSRPFPCSNIITSAALSLYSFSEQRPAGHRLRCAPGHAPHAGTDVFVHPFISPLQ